MKQFFILLFAVFTLFSSCKEKNDDFPVREPDVFFYKTNNISPRDISCMVYNNDHDVFLGSKNKDEVLHLGIHGWEVIAIPTPHNVNPGINCILYDDVKRLWIGTNHGLYRYSDGKVKRVPGFDTRKINCMGKTWYQRVWVGMDAKENEKNVGFFDKNDSLQFLYPNMEHVKANITNIIPISVSVGYFTDDQGGIYRYDNSGFSYFHGYLGENAKFTCSCIMNSDHFCFGTSSSYLLMSGAYSYFSLKPIYCGSEINSVCYSPDTALWIGTAGSGLIRFNDETFIAYDKFSAKLSSDTILSVVPADDKHILCSIPGGKVYLMPINQ